MNLRKDYCGSSSLCVIWLNPHDIIVSEALLCPFNRWENWGSEVQRLIDLPKHIPLMKGNIELNSVLFDIKTFALSTALRSWWSLFYQRISHDILTSKAQRTFITVFAHRKIFMSTEDRLKAICREAESPIYCQLQLRPASKSSMSPAIGVALFDSAWVGFTR